MAKLTKAEVRDYIDLLGKIRAQQSDLKNAEDDVKARLLEHLGEGVFEGNLFRLNIFKQVSMRLNTDAVKRFLGKKLPEFQTQCESTVMKVSARVADGKGEV